MAIRLFTGLPGAGKTLRAIYEALEMKTKESRPVYHIGIDGMKEEFIPAAPIDSIEDWRKLPPGSILLVDEAHKWLPVRSPGKPPDWIQAITEIRHFGVELWLITQDPRNLDSFVRRLIGKHIHISRKAGFKGAMIREFEGVSEDPNDYHNRQGTTQTPWKYPKHLFQVYKSATLHVVKPKIPKKILFGGILIVACVIVIPYMIYRVYSTVQNRQDQTNQQSSQASAFSASSSALDSKKGSNNLGSNGNEKLSWNTAEEFMKAHTPLIPGIPWSAPIHSNLTPTTVPEIYCIAAGYENAPDRTCNCYTEQATKIQGIHPAICETYARQGSYNPYRANTPNMVSTNMGATIVEASVDAVTTSQGSVIPYKEKDVLK